MLTFQLLSKDGSSLNDAEVLLGCWQTYVEGFVSKSEMPAFPAAKCAAHSFEGPSIRLSLARPDTNHFLLSSLQDPCHQAP